MMRTDSEKKILQERLAALEKELADLREYVRVQPINEHECDVRMKMAEKENADLKAKLDKVIGGEVRRFYRERDSEHLIILNKENKELRAALEQAQTWKGGMPIEGDIALCAWTKIGNGYYWTPKTGPRLDHTRDTPEAKR